MHSRLVFALLLLVACTHKTPEQKLRDDIDTAASWVATLQFAGEKWLANSVPSSFMRATIDGATKNFDQTMKRSELRDSIRDQIQFARAAAEQMRTAIEHNDRRSVAEQVRRFAVANAALRKEPQ